MAHTDCPPIDPWSSTEEATRYKSHSQECALYWRGEEASSLRPGTVALREIRRYQKSTELLIPNSPSSVWCGKLLRTSKQICTSRVQLLVLCRRQVRPIWLAFLKTPTCVLSMPNYPNIAIHVAIMPKDIQLARHIRGERA